MAINRWQRRAKEAALSQSLLAWIVGKSPMGVSRAMRAMSKRGVVPRYLKAVILAWEIMTPEQRRRWTAELEAAEAGENVGGDDNSPPASGQGASTCDDRG